MNIILFSVELSKFSLKVFAYVAENFPEVVENSFCKDAIPIFGDEDQMNMHEKDAMSASTNFVDFFHRPNIVMA